jgi:hypothetical protein
VTRGDGQEQAVHDHGSGLPKQFLVLAKKSKDLRAEADGLEVQHGRGHGGAKADDQRPGER